MTVVGPLIASCLYFARIVVIRIPFNNFASQHRAAIFNFFKNIEPGGTQTRRWQTGFLYRNVFSVNNRSVTGRRTGNRRAVSVTLNRLPERDADSDQGGML